MDLLDSRVGQERAPMSAPTRADGPASRISALEAILATAEARLRATFTHNADGVLIVDEGGHVRLANPAAGRLCERTAAMLVGAPFGLPFTSDTPLQVEITTPSRGRTLVELHSAPAEWEGARARVVTLRDVTDRRLRGEGRGLPHDAVRESPEVEQSLAQTMDAVGRLAGGVAHDFNNLLMAVLGYAEVLRDEAAQLPAAAGPLDAIVSAATQAATLTRQLLSFSGKQILRPRVLDLNATVRGLLPRLKSVVGEGVHVETDLDPALPAIEADPAQLEESILAVAANARDTMPQGGRLCVETRARPATDGGPAAAEVRFADTGQGLPPEALERLFEPFFNGMGLSRGGGLVLASVYGFVRQSGGRIHVESTEGHGTTVAILLPASPRPDADAALRAGSAVRNATILVVEDDDAVRELTRRVLAQAGHRVIAAASGEDALELVGTIAIDLVVTDVVMPGMNGRELVERLKQTHPLTRVIFSSGYTADAVLQRGVASHEVAFLEKPYSLAQLRRAVQRALSQPPPTG
jgi:signal transduction histidine kinase/CheY-like chemotaxis protein